MGWEAQGSGRGPPTAVSSSYSQATEADGAPRGALPSGVSLALQRIEEASGWAETATGWDSASPAEAERYGEALSALAEACSGVALRDALFSWEGLAKEPSQGEGSPRGPFLLRHIYRVFCTLCSIALAEAGVDYGGLSSPAGDPKAASQEARGASVVPSADEWLSRGQPLLAALGGSSLIAACLRRVVLVLYPLTSCLWGCRAAAGAAALLQTPEGAHSLCFLAALAAAAAEEQARSLPTAGARATPGGTTAAATDPPSSATPNSGSNSGSSSNSSSLLLPLLGAYEGPLALPGVAAAARGGPLRGLHKAVQRGAARLLGKAASLPDSATAVLAWLVYRRLSSSGSSSNNSSSDGSFSATNIRHLLALLIASVRNHLGRPLEQRVSALCLREALKEPRMREALAAATHDAALAFVAVCLQSLQAVAAAAETAAKAPHAEATAASTETAARQQLAAAAPISEMLALICASSKAVRASVAARLDCLPPPQQPSGVAAAADGSSSYTRACGTPADHQQQQQQQQAFQTSPGKGRSSAALSAASLPALFYIAAKGGNLECMYTTAFLELCISGQGARGIGRRLSLQQREEAVTALAANAGLLGKHERISICFYSRYGGADSGREGL